MKSINVSKKVFNTLEELQLPSEVLSTESKLYIYNFRGQEKVVKKLYKTNGEYYATKLYTVEMLDNCRDNLPNNFIIPDYTFSINQENVGFTVPKVNGITLSTILKNTKVDTADQLEYLRQVGDMIRQLAYIRRYTGLKDIYLNDINESNFMVNPKNREVYAIDLDSVKIGSNKIFPGRYLSKTGLLSSVPEKYIRNESAWEESLDEEDNYKKYSLSEGYYIPSANTDLYCYTLLILNYLYGDNVGKLSLQEFYNYLSYLSDLKINKELLDCFANIVNTPDNGNPSNYLESLTTEQVCRAKSKIYKINMNRKS